MLWASMSSHEATIAGFSCGQTVSGCSGFGFRVYNLGFRVYNLGFRV